MKRSFISAGAVAALVVVGMALSPAPVLATSIITFNIVSPTSGTITYDGLGGPLVGADITVDSVTGAPPPPGGPFACGGCVLDFTTGDFTGSTATTWTFAGGGDITITGAFASAGIPPGSTLLSGSFIGPTTVTDVGATLKISSGPFSDLKHDDLAAFYGFPPGQIFKGGLALSFLSGASPPSGFTSSAPTVGLATNAPIPEPASLLLLGSGLLGLAAYGRKRIKNMMNS